MSDTVRERVVVTVADERLTESVAASLGSVGMRVDPKGVHTNIGIITGEIDQSKLHQLQSVPGVAAVEKDSEMKAI